MIEENNLNHYYKNGLLIATVNCDWKCLKESNLSLDVCQNSHTNKMKTKTIEVSKLVCMFEENLMSDCVIFAGLEPMLQIEEIVKFIEVFRVSNDSDVIIYTGYYKKEIEDTVNRLKKYDNIIIKFGRFIPNVDSVYDNVLKIKLVSGNQYAEKIS